MADLASVGNQKKVSPYRGTTTRRITNVKRTSKRVGPSHHRTSYASKHFHSVFSRTNALNRARKVKVQVRSVNFIKAHLTRLEPEVMKPHLKPVRYT